MEGHYAESQQFEERLEEEGSVSRSSGEAGLAEASNFGAHSPVGFMKRCVLCTEVPDFLQGEQENSTFIVTSCCSACSGPHEVRYPQQCLSSLPIQQTQLQMLLSLVRTVLHPRPSQRVRTLPHVTISSRKCLVVMANPFFL